MAMVKCRNYEKEGLSYNIQRWEKDEVVRSTFREVRGRQREHGVTEAEG